MADQRRELLWSGRSSTREVRKARRNFQHVLQEDRRRRVKLTRGNIEGLLEAGRGKEAWDHLSRWYQQVRGKQTHPTREGLDQGSADRAELYMCRPPAILQVPILVQPPAVNDDIPE